MQFVLVYRVGNYWTLICPQRRSVGSSRHFGLRGKRNVGTSKKAAKGVGEKESR